MKVIRNKELRDHNSLTSFYPQLLDKLINRLPYPNNIQALRPKRLHQYHKYYLKPWTKLSKCKNSLGASIKHYLNFFIVVIHLDV